MFCQTSAIRQQTKACFVCRWGAIRESHIETVLGKTLCTYVQEHGVIRPATVRTYLLKQWNSVYMRSGNRFNSEKSPHPPSGGVGDPVAVFQIVLALIGDHSITKAAPLQRRQIVFLTPHLVNFIQFLTEWYCLLSAGYIPRIPENQRYYYYPV